MQRFTFLFFIVAASGLLYIACKRSPVPTLPQEPEMIITPEGDTIYIINNDTIYVNVEVPVDPTAHPCSPDSVYFEQQLLPLIQSNCAVPTCHDNITHKENIWLTNYEQVLTTGGVKLNSPTTSKLYTSTSPTAGERMPPPPRAALTAAQRALLLKWIQQGAQDLHCDAACDTTIFTYTAVIQPIINTRCVGCHSGSAPSGSISYTTYAGVKASVDNGKFYKSIIHASGATAMPYPQGSAKIPDCDIIKIRKWIDAGALNN
jgi:uncharacterized membrane protein